MSRRQLLDAGWHRSSIGRAVEADRLLPVHAGVYAVGHRAIGDDGRWMAAVLAGGAGFVLNHLSAAALHAVAGRDTGMTHVAGPVALARPRIVGHRVTLDPRDCTVRWGIPVTTVARTLVDLATDRRHIDDHALERMVREAMFRGLFDDTAVADALTRRRAPRLARYLGEDGRTQSELEDLFLRICRRHRIPPPLTQRGTSPRVDFVWPQGRLVVEVDGWAAHRTKVAFQRDRATTNALQLDGFTVLRFTYDDLTRRPAQVAAQIRRALRNRT